MPRRWYVVNTKLSSEKIAAENLKKQKIQTFLPLSSCIVRNSKRTTALFPNYLFVKVDTKKNDWRKIQNTHGVRHILSATEDGIACPVQEGVVEEFRKKADRKGVIAFEDFSETIKKISIGSKVLISEGSLIGSEGVCSQVIGNTAILILSLLSRETRVRVSLNAVKEV